MITSDGFFDWMAYVPGPSDKVYSEPCTSELYIPHSAVGYYQGWESRLFSTARLANGQYTPYAAASVTGWFFQEAGRTPVQHYSLKKSCWASGTRSLNVRGNAFENAGGPPSNPGEPLTEWQIECNLRAMREINEWKGRPPDYWRRPAFVGDLTATAYEHNESPWFGGEPTACPSGRAQTLWQRLAAGAPQEDDVTPEEHEWLRTAASSAGNVDRETDLIVQQWPWMLAALVRTHDAAVQSKAILFDDWTGDANTSEADRKRRLIGIGQQVKALKDRGLTAEERAALTKIAASPSTPVLLRSALQKVLV